MDLRQQAASATEHEARCPDACLGAAGEGAPVLSEFVIDLSPRVPSSKLGDARLCVDAERLQGSHVDHHAAGATSVVLKPVASAPGADVQPAVATWWLGRLGRRDTSYGSANLTHRTGGDNRARKGLNVAAAIAKRLLRGVFIAGWEDDAAACAAKTRGETVL